MSLTSINAAAAVDMMMVSALSSFAAPVQTARQYSKVVNMVGISAGGASRAGTRTSTSLPLERPKIRVLRNGVNCAKSRVLPSMARFSTASRRAVSRCSS